MAESGSKVMAIDTSIFFRILQTFNIFSQLIGVNTKISTQLIEYILLVM